MINEVDFKIDGDGHFLIYGPSSTGKTRYLQYLLPKLKEKGVAFIVFSGATSASQWSKYTVYTSKFTEIMTKLMELNTECKKYKRIYVVIDDYDLKPCLPFLSDMVYPKCRHSGIFMINLVQNSKRLASPLIRNNSQFIGIMAGTNESEIKEICKNSDSEKTLKIVGLAKRLIKEGHGYSIIIQKRLSPDIMYDYVKENRIVNRIDNPVQLHPNTTYPNAMIPMVSSPMSMPNNNPTANMLQNFNVGNNNHGQQNNNVLINNVPTITQEQRIRAMQQKVELKQEELKAMMAIKKEEDKVELFYLIRSRKRNTENVEKIILILNRSFLDNGANIGNYKYYINKFMKKYYPEYNFTESDAPINQMMELYTNRNDNMMLATSAYHMLSSYIPLPDGLKRLAGL